MQWDAILRDSLRPAAPYVVWLGLALATSILVAIIREPLARALREARHQLDLLRRRLVARSALSLGRRSRRFWLLQQYEPARTIAASLDRLAQALPSVGRKSLRRLTALENELRRQVGRLEALGLQVPLRLTLPAEEPAPAVVVNGSWSKLLLLVFISGLTGTANSFLLNEFFQGVITADPLFPTAFPDLHVSHVFAVLIFSMEVAIGFALHHFGEDQDDASAARKLLAMAPWVVLVGLLWLEGWAYALLSYQIDIPERLGLPATSGLYSFARYFLALFGAGLTLLLASLGYLLGKEVERIQAGAEFRRRERLLRREGWAVTAAAQQVERTERALERLHAGIASFHLNLVQQFKREVDPAGNSDELLTAIRDAMNSILESPNRVGGTLARALKGLDPGERLPLRSRAQVIGDMTLSSAALLSLGAVSWLSEQYLAAFARSVQGERQSAELFGLLSGVLMTGFGVSAGYVAAHARRGSRHLSLLAVPLVIGAAGALTAVAIANHTLGSWLPLNTLFGLLHAGSLTLLGAVAGSAAVGGLHLLQLTGMSAERWIVRLVAFGLWSLQALAAMIEWVIRLVAVFGQLVVRPRPPVQVGVAEISPGRRLPRELLSPARRFTDKPYAAAAREKNG